MPAFVRLKDVEAIRAAVVATYLTQAEICRRADFYPATLSNLLRGRTRVIEMDSAARLETALEVDRGSLFVLHENLNPELIVAYLPRDEQLARGA